MQYCWVTHTGFGLAGFAQAGKSHSAIGGLVLSAQTDSQDPYKNFLFESTESLASLHVPVAIALYYCNLTS